MTLQRSHHRHNARAPHRPYPDLVRPAQAQDGNRAARVAGRGRPAGGPLTQRAGGSHTPAGTGQTAGRERGQMAGRAYTPTATITPMTDTRDTRPLYTPPSTVPEMPDTPGYVPRPQARIEKGHAAQLSGGKEDSHHRATPIGFLAEQVEAQEDKSINPLACQFHAVLISTEHGNIDRNFGAARSHDAAIDTAARTLISDPSAFAGKGIETDPDILDRACEIADRTMPPEIRDLIPNWREQAMEGRRRQHRDERLETLQQEREQEQKEAQRAAAQAQAVDRTAARREIGEQANHEVLIVLRPKIIRNPHEEIQLLFTWEPDGQDDQPTTRLLSIQEARDWADENDVSQAAITLSMYAEGPAPAVIAKGRKATW